MTVKLVIICLLASAILGKRSLAYKATSSLAFFEHSYFAQMTNEYLTNHRLQFYQLEQFFISSCPAPTLSESIFLASPEVLEEAYIRQEAQFLSNEQFIEREASFGLLEKVFGFLFNNPDQGRHDQINKVIKQNNQKKISKPSPSTGTQQKLTHLAQTAGQAYQSVKSNIHDFYTNNMEFREMISLNVQLKARPLIAILFICSFALVLFRLSKKSETSRQKVPKTMCIFWFFATIQLYLELNWLSIEPQPKSYSKILFLGIVPIEQASNYIPEIMNLLLFVICLFYFFSLIFRFNEIFGQEDLPEQQQYLEQLNRIASQQTISQMRKERQRQGGQGSNEEEIQAQAAQHEESEDDFSLSGFATQPIMQVSPLTMRNALELYHFIIIHLTLFLTFLKILMLCEGILFVRISNNMIVSTLNYGKHITYL